MSNLELEITEKNKIVRFQEEIEYKEIPNREQLVDDEINGMYKDYISNKNNISIQNQNLILNQIKYHHKLNNQNHWNQIYQNQRNERIIALKQQNNKLKNQSYFKPTMSSIKKIKILKAKPKSMGVFLFTR